mgnify:CR=1 FL=1
MATRNFVVKNGLTVGTATLDAATGNLTVTNAALGTLASATTFAGSGASLTNIPGANVTGTVPLATTAGTVSTAAQPNITSLGTLTSVAVTGNVTAGNVKTDNLLYANGTAWDLGGNPGGTNTFVQYNNDGEFGGDSGFTFDDVTGVLSITGNVSTGNVSGSLGSFTTVAGALTTAAQPNITSTGTLTGLTVTNPIVGSVTGTSSTVTTGAQPNVTSVGTLSSLAVTGNVDTSANIVTDSIIGKTAGVTITAIGTNQPITLVPTGTGAVAVSSKRITDLATPTASTDAATKQYVDDVAQGLAVHAPCRVASTGTVATMSGGTVTYDNGTAGVGATLTISGGSITVIDGTTLTTDDRILIKDETGGNLPNNGIYVYTSSTVLTRADDFDTPTEIAGGDFTFVSTGTIYNDSGWVNTDPVTTVGTDDITFVQFSGAGTYTAGAGLTLTGTEFLITDTAVAAQAYGNGTHNATFTVNSKGQLTNASNVAITANAEVLTGTSIASGVTGSSLTSVGTLGSLDVTGNVGAGNVSGTAGSFTTVAGSLTTAAQPNITSVGTLSGLTVTAGIVGSVTGTASTITTAAQPNITSVGTLSALTVTGITATGTLQTDNLQYANGNPWDLSDPGGANTNVQFNDSEDFGGSANFTFDKDTSNLTVTGNIIVATGTIGGDAGGISNVVGANVTGEVTFAATANAVAGANVSGAVSFATTANAVAGANVSGTVPLASTAGTVTTAAQPNITSVGTLTSVTTTGEVNAVSFGTSRSNVTVSTNTVIDEFDPSTYRTAKYVVSASGDDGYQSVETLLVHDGSDAYITIYGSICSNVSADIVELSSNINGVSGNVTVYATTSSSNTNLNIVAQRILT